MKPLLMIFVIASLATACGTGTGDKKTPTLPPATNTGDLTAAEGISLYAENCARCHGKLADSERKGRSADQIYGAILNSEVMRAVPELKALSADEIRAIAEALKAKKTTVP